jgi:hypothetical protein
MTTPPRLTRRRTLTILTALAGGALGYGTVSRVRGEPVRTETLGDGATTIHWRSRPDVRARENGPVLDLGSLEPGRTEELPVRVRVANGPVRLGLGCDVTPDSVPAKRIHLRARGTTDAFATPNEPRGRGTDHVYASGPIADIFDAGSGDGRGELELTANEHPAVETAGPWYPEAGSYDYGIAWGVPTAVDESAVPDGARLALEFASTSRPSDGERSRPQGGPGTSTQYCSTNDTNGPPSDAGSRFFRQNDRR